MLYTGLGLNSLPPTKTEKQLCLPSVNDVVVEPGNDDENWLVDTGYHAKETLFAALLS